MRKSILLFLLFLGICYFPIFLHLDGLPISAFDEARPANNAIEMLESGNMFVMQYRGEPDLWYTKPPLMIWLQVICLKFLGYNELAVRMPTAFAALFTVILVLWFGYKKMGSLTLGLFSSLVLLTTHGYIGEHVSRTADPDTLLTLFITIYCLMYYLFLETGNRKYMYTFGFALALAALTKGVAAFLFLPGLLLYTLAVKKMGAVLRSRSFYYTIAIVLVPVLGFYLTREFLNPGYIEAVVHHELGRRMTDPIEGHSGPATYYLKFIYKKHFWPWLLLIPVALLFLSRSSKAMQRLLLMIVLSTGIYLLIISMAQTKVFWYTALMFPLWALLVGFSIDRIFQFLGNYLALTTSMRKGVFVSVFAIAFFFVPYKSVIDKITNAHTTFPLNYHGLFLKKMQNKQKDLVMIDGKYNGSQVFSMRCYNEKGYNITMDSVHNLQVGQVVLFCTSNEIDSMNHYYRFDIIESFKTCVTARITERQR